MDDPTGISSDGYDSSQLKSRGGPGIWNIFINCYDVRKLKVLTTTAGRTEIFAIVCIINNCAYDDEACLGWKPGHRFGFCTYVSNNPVQTFFQDPRPEVWVKPKLTSEVWRRNW